MAANPSEGKLSTVLVTGGTDGLGRATSILLAERGYRVFAAGRNAERLEALRNLACERKLPLEPLELDVCDAASGERAIAEIERRTGPVDILVNNAGIAIAAVMEEITPADLRKVFETNVFGPIRLAQRVLPEMRRRRRGRIINMSSISGKVAIPVMGTYASSKHALEAASDSMRLELYPFSIHVVLIEPGYIHTSMNRTAAELSSAYAKGAEQSPYKGIYQGFLGEWEKTRKTSRYQPEDCARVVLRAVEDEPPRARYAVTSRARFGIFARRFLSDQALDNRFRKAFRLDDLRESLA
ncbi:MAG TPA: SDR family oxidoreductase, partial [Candidatus Acidoferrales bacterium]|nr:SDR family oxidoreductase [Candidatus Acidoferrales bacterium]